MASTVTEVRPNRVRPFSWEFDLFHNYDEQYAILYICDNRGVTVTSGRRFEGPYYHVAVAREITKMNHHKIDVRFFGDRFIGYIVDSIKEEYFPNPKKNDFRYKYTEEGNYSFWECCIPPNGKLIRLHL